MEPTALYHVVGSCCHTAAPYQPISSHAAASTPLSAIYANIPLHCCFHNNLHTCLASTTLNFSTVCSPTVSAQSDLYLTTLNGVQDVQLFNIALL